jgi:hypothetical protein
MQKRSRRKQRTRTKNVITGSEQLEEKSGQQSLPTETDPSALSQSDEHDEENEGNTKRPPLTAEEADRRFDEGEDVFSLGVSKEGWTRPGLVSKRFNVDVPAHLLEKLDDAALLRGITRQALVKTWLYDRLLQEKK